MISVIVPLYNKADTIVRTLDSVRHQSFQDYEVVVVDDGSTDESASVVRSYKEIRSLLIVSQKNAGVSAARNRGVHEAKGEYLAFLDGDDVWESDHLQRLNDVVHAYENVRVVCSGYRWRCGNVEYSTRASKRPFSTDFYDECRHYLPAHTSAFMVEKRLFDAVGGFTEGCSIFEYYLLFFKLAVVTRFYFTGKVTEFHTDDSKERITSSGGKRTAEESMPHLLYLQRQVAHHQATASMVELLKWEIVRRMAICLRHHDRQGVTELKRLFGQYCCTPLLLFACQWELAAKVVGFYYSSIAAVGARMKIAKRKVG